MNSLSSINVSPSVKPKTRCWVLDDARPGHLHQSLALVRALGLDNYLETIPLPEAQKKASQLSRDSGLGLLIGCGRRAAYCSKKIKQTQPALWTTIQILNPRNSREGFDWVLVPGHDGVIGPGVISFVGSLTQIDEQFIASARSEFSWFGQLSSPRMVMLTGGPTRRATWRRSDLKRWLKEFDDHAKQRGGTALLMNSRRTPVWANNLMKRFCASSPHFYRHDEVENPYCGLLAFADCIWVTADSVNMLAEACSTSRPVRALGGERLKGRIRVCWQQLEQSGRLMEDWSNPTSGSYEPLREARRVAVELRLRGALIGIEQPAP